MTSIRAGERRRLRVLTLIDRAFAFGGAELLARHILTRLDSDRFERIVCGTRAEPASLVAPETFEREGIRFLSLDRHSRTDVVAWRPLLSLIARERIDVLHTHKFGSNASGAILGRLARVPVIVAHEHTWSFEGQRLRRLIDREVVARGASVIVAVSREDRRRMIAIERIDPNVVRFIPNGIPPLAPPSGRDVRAELAIPADAPLIGSVSVLRPQKALDVLIEAAWILHHEFSRVRVLIAGVGPERETLERLIRERGLTDVVTLLGGRRDVPDLLAALDIAVNSSDFEGTPLAVLEYMAAGKGIVATRVGGVPDLIEDGVHGLLVAPRDPHALACAIADLVRSPSLRADMGSRARERQRREFDIDVTVRRIEDLYEQLYLASARRRREAFAATDRSRVLDAFA